MSESMSMRTERHQVGRLGELFLQQGLLTEAQIEQIAHEQRQHKLRFGDAALRLGLLTQAQIDQALGQQFGFTSKDLLNGIADPSLRFFHQPFSKEAEEIRRLRSELLLKFDTADKIRIAVVSSASGEGKSYMAVSLAIALSQVGRRTLLIDGDLRSGSLHQFFALGSPDGLSSVLAGRQQLDEVLIPLLPGLQLLPSGPRPPNPLELLQVPRIKDLLDSCYADFDAFVVDTHASGNASDAQMLAHQVGTALLVAKKDLTRISDLRQVKNDMQAAGVDIAGTVYNEYQSLQKKRWFQTVLNWMPGRRKKNAKRKN
ncbi:CpsD/CapB family tyrosine-protein kinase [Undibacterium curvum]|uniref:Polysaccharide biosynthesis tyrosine autokinase n=1 Tax=Undibacterium curvum TaxID=2762294 RepID=A0ABR7A175_9BURK|nr:CpsD/CapB family tyrosine-protein kinase [Undibacterium curvum]MBC3930501.1 polysaccharide biosynthesis tyrosine autokinase [Undibacterium curvum]